MIDFDALEAATVDCIDTATDHALICALWVMPGDEETESPGDAFGLADVSQEVRDAVREEIGAFLMTCWDEGLDLSPIEPEQIGHDFWLTRNGHGAGFWDRGLGDLGDRLTELCKPYGEQNLYVGDDGTLYLS